MVVVVVVQQWWYCSGGSGEGNLNVRWSCGCDVAFDAGCSGEAFLLAFLYVFFHAA